jgi:hypothetical protein
MSLSNDGARTSDNAIALRRDLSYKPLGKKTPSLESDGGV